MKLIDHVIDCKSRADRAEIFVFGDCHIGKRNCDEQAIRKQVKEVLRRSELANRYVRVLYGGDIVNAINPRGDKRFAYGDVADWLVGEDAAATRKNLTRLPAAEKARAVDIFSALSRFSIGAIEGNHEEAMKKYYSQDVHGEFCESMNIPDLTDEAIVRLRFKRKMGAGVTVLLYIRHGYGAGRSAGAEPSKIENMLKEWANMDVCLTGHTHTFCSPVMLPVLYVPRGGKLPSRLRTRHRFGANWGCWLLSHLQGESSYESRACYPARPMMTVKVVVWPFWNTKHRGENVEEPKIELRSYPIL